MNTCKSILAAALTALTLGAGSAAANSYITDAKDGDDVTISGCVIRFDTPDRTPRIHANGAHTCAGVERVYYGRDGRLWVDQSVKDAAANPIVSAMVQTDERIAGDGIIAGASGGTDDTSYVFHDTRLGRDLDLTKQADRNRLGGPSRNIWLLWVHAPSGR